MSIYITQLVNRYLQITSVHPNELRSARKFLLDDGSEADYESYRLVNQASDFPWKYLQVRCIVKKSWNYGDVMEIVSARRSHGSEVLSGLLVTIRAEAGSRVAGPSSWEVDYAEICHAQCVNTQRRKITLMILKDQFAVTHGSSSQERGIL
jgi:hypothetical protein